MTEPAAVLDHRVVAAHTLDQGSAYVQDCPGVPMTGGGKHAAMGTHNRVLRLNQKLPLTDRPSFKGADHVS